MNICTYSYEEYLHLVKSFHGTLAPGLLIGGFMVDLAMKHLPEGEFFDAVCETPVCLPDAVQILTPCTIGNGWLSVVSFGKFAITLYEKYGGRGVRVYLDTGKLNQWPEIRDWYLKKKKKNEQNSELLFAQIKDAGHGLFSIQHVQVDPEKVRRKKMGPVAVCPVCREAYPTRDGEKCRSCQGDSPFTEIKPIS
ncbi:MAG: FmdE, Molybdenum formylmethanofuran dehydrogenase operon [Deltaproteobacteria bacterium ADurb.Bin151]|jgi:formylmethanofuran dehydrogenase subunit E|nr:tRNA CCA-pyrophosphorylase [Smithella sp.]OQB54089.1 MAG: FmdE, Molybdenum formylmethanofuran dehydrogenase operon [Deltaproteobacteria bacterium ADurb.Bin151]HNZ11015.1 formylmethanofuran dehydrogenase subunit E family protein [Smithellaceae bacterium]HOG81543.1 formylmethanofuran dehydrogenase subunit E family protein [Smithellaceae bacterium]HOQ43445.1 formylmethanofuran dehydrogenase subunit E family protein [Smithellaceae bacterium]